MGQTTRDKQQTIWDKQTTWYKKMMQSETNVVDSEVEYK